MDAKRRIVQTDVGKGRRTDPTYTEAMKAYHKYLASDVCTDDEYLQAFQAYSDVLQSEILESLILANAEPRDVKTIFGVSEKTLRTYRELFFDISKIKTKLQMVSYLEGLPPGLGKELKLRAVNLGPEYVFFTYGNAIPKTEVQKDLVRRMFMTSAYKAMSMNFSSMNSKTSKNAIEHAKLMLKAYETMDKLLKDGAESDMEFLEVLTQGSMSYTFEPKPAKRDIV